MNLKSICHIFGIRIAYFHWISIKKFPPGIRLIEMFVDQLEEQSCHIFFNTVLIRWIKPNNFSACASFFPFYIPSGREFHNLQVALQSLI